MKDNKYTRFASLNYDKFKELASDTSLSSAEKIGFPDEYRSGFDKAILSDIIHKCNLENKPAKSKILDIGSGCGTLIKMFIDYCVEREYELFLGDSKEMLDLLDTKGKPMIKKLPGFWPADFDQFIQQHKGTFDSIITYSVFHYTFEEANIHEFIEKTLPLLKPNGNFLIGDIPNITKRNRFFSSDQGVAYHRNFVGDTTSFPEVSTNRLMPNKIDDGVLMGLMARYRNYGYDAYLLPQANNLPMSNRREDLLITKL